MEEKKFKPFDKVLVKDNQGFWQIDFYSHREKEFNLHQVLSYGDCNYYEDDHILPFEGNEHLLGKSDSPDEEVELLEGEWVMYAYGGLVSIYPLDYKLGKFIKINEGDNTITIQDSDAVRRSSKFIKFSDFNPNDMEETKKHILVGKNGKVVRYKE